MNYQDLAKTLSESTRKRDYVRPEEPGHKGLEDVKQERLEKEWRGLVKSKRAITKETICRNHALRLQDWEMWFTQNVTNLDKYRHGKDFFSFGDGDVAMLVEVDNEIGKSLIDKRLGASGERYEQKRMADRTGAGQMYAFTGDDELDRENMARAHNLGSD